MATVSGVNIEVVLPKSCLGDLEKDLMQGLLGKISGSLTSIDVQKARAWNVDDETMIKGKIERTIGHAAVNGVVKAFLCQWLADTFQDILQSAKVSPPGREIFRILDQAGDGKVCLQEFKE